MKGRKLTQVLKTVNANNQTVLTGSVLPGKTWIWGNVYSATSNERAEGKLFSSSRPAPLVDGSGAYYTIKPPTFQEWDVKDVVNVKSVCNWPVAGDGVTDEYVP